MFWRHLAWSGWKRADTAPKSKHRTGPLSKGAARLDQHISVLHNRAKPALYSVWKRVSTDTKAQRWNVNKYIYSSTVLKYKFEVFVLYLSIFFSSHFILLLHYIYLAALVTLQIQTFEHKTYKELPKYAVLF